MPNVIPVAPADSGAVQAPSPGPGFQQSARSPLKSAKLAAFQMADATGFTRRLRDSAWRSGRLLVLAYHGVSTFDEHEWNPELYLPHHALRARFEILKAEGYSFTVFTPGDGLRLASDRGRDDFVEFALDTSGDRPQVIGRISQSRGSRRLEEERPVKADTPPDALSEEDVLDFVMHALGPWLAR